MNSSLRRRLVETYGEHKVKALELEFRPVKIKRERKMFEHSRRISRNVIRRRREER